jgi:hypothetical protein
VSAACVTVPVGSAGVASGFTCTTCDCSDYCHRIGTQWIGFPSWQRGPQQDRDKIALSKAEKKCLSLVKELMKRKGGSFFEFAVDPSADDSGGLNDYFDKVRSNCWCNLHHLSLSPLSNILPESQTPA